MAIWSAGLMDTSAVGVRFTKLPPLPAPKVRAAASAAMATCSPRKASVSAAPVAPVAPATPAGPAGPWAPARPAAPGAPAGPGGPTAPAIPRAHFAVSRADFSIVAKTLGLICAVLVIKYLDAAHAPPASSEPAKTDKTTVVHTRRRHRNARTSRASVSTSSRVEVP